MQLQLPFPVTICTHGGKAPSIPFLLACFIAGSLPSAWPRLWPRLQFFFLYNNNFHAGSAMPSALPSSWTKPSTPAIFPDLSYLVLYPGNDKLCFLPDGNTGGFAEVAPGEMQPGQHCLFSTPKVA
jgi:hypothetical protein